MNVEQEHYLWRSLEIGRKPREVIEELVTAGIWSSAKPAHRTLEKWVNRGLYEYGVNLDLGWLSKNAVFPRTHELMQLEAEPVDPDDEHMTLGDFLANVGVGAYTEDDGRGCYASTTHKFPRLGVTPAQVLHHGPDLRFSHVVWFNK